MVAMGPLLTFAACRKHASIAVAGREGCKSVPSEVQVRMMMETFDMPASSLGATGPVLYDRMAACISAYGSMVSLP